MASLSAACRLSGRAVSRQLRAQSSARGIHTSKPALAAHNFTMPAMSPTMTEGNIAAWKVKEGDSFSAGDLLLEIETDKAQMDVEAQEDGVMAKITVGDGSKAVKVGTRIAVLADAGDDVSTLEIPSEDKPTASSKPTKEEAPKPQAEAAPAPKPTAETTSSAAAGKAQKQTYPLYPAVQHLVHENGLDADKIPATGPNGRLLKGDVLAFIGRIEKAYSAQQSQRISKLGHLDLSNVKAAPKKVPEAAPAKPAAPESIVEPDTEVAVPISLTAVLQTQKRVQDTIGTTLPLSTFFARAADLANEGLPRSKSSKPTADELFNAVLGLDKVASFEGSRGHFAPQVTALPAVFPAQSARSALRKPDVLDILSGKASAKSTPRFPRTVASSLPPTNIFSVSVPKGEAQRAKVFLERVKVVLEENPGQLIL